MSKFEPNRQSTNTRPRPGFRSAKTAAPADKARWSLSAGRQGTDQPMVRDHTVYASRAHLMPQSGESYRWYVKGKLYKQVLAPGSRRRPAEAGDTKVLVFFIALHMSTGPSPCMARR
jgi:hypothetical protein